MNYSQIYISALVVILVQLNNLFGFNLGNDQITDIASGLVSIGVSIWIAIRRHQTGDINVVGVKTDTIPE